MYSLFYLCFSILIIYTESTALEPRVFSGENLRPNVHKYLVRLDIKGINMDGSCSGSVIHKNWIITAAHCLLYKNLTIEVKQEVDQIQRLVAYEERPTYVIYSGFEFQYTNSAQNMEKDLGLLKLKQEMRFDDWLQPIPLSEDFIKIGQEVTIAGYGDAEDGLTVPREGCTNVTSCGFSSDYKLICTNSRVSLGHGDSGGPLVADGHLVGVTSSACDEKDVYGKCENYYVDVAKHNIWIRGVMNGIIS